MHLIPVFRTGDPLTLNGRNGFRHFPLFGKRQKYQADPSTKKKINYSIELKGWRSGVIHQVSLSQSSWNIMLNEVSEL